MVEGEIGMTMGGPPNHTNQQPREEVVQIGGKEDRMREIDNLRGSNQV